MQTTSNTEAGRAVLCSTINVKVRKPVLTRKPNPSGLSREELQKLVAEMIG